jgi:hypothetical protein
MTKTSLSPAEVARRSERRAFIEEERVRLAQQRVVDERERVASTAAKTARLRQLREAREEAEREVAAVSAAAKLRSGAGKAKPKAAPAIRKARRPG